MKLIVGLGNPGHEYQATPHNLGFRAADRLAEESGMEIARPEHEALTAHGSLDGVRVVLAKPQTYMNLSGSAVARLVQKYEVPAADLIVLVDEVNLPLGAVRVRPRGSAGGHNGMKSIIAALETNEFVRVRMGVQPDPPVEDRTSYLLGRFRKADADAVENMVDQAAEAVRVILKEGVEKAMNRFNRRIPTEQ